MADFKITGQTIAVLQKSLDLRAEKQQVIAGNIANAETPGYASRKFSFEENLRDAINNPGIAARQTNIRHFPIGSGSIEAVQGTLDKDIDHSPLGDGNTVSMEDEMFDLAENQLLYEAGSQIIRKKLSLLKYAANNGSGS